MGTFRYKAFIAYSQPAQVGRQRGEVGMDQANLVRQAILKNETAIAEDKQIDISIVQAGGGA